MYPLFETIRYYNGVIEKVDLHQQRVDYTLTQLNSNAKINLYEQINMQTNKPSFDDVVYKCRFQYDLNGNVNVQFEPYTLRNINTFSIQDIGPNKYPYKYSDRKWINEILKNASTDEIILTYNGYIKDASYANLVFFDGEQWITPANPLLIGTKRAELLSSGVIIEAPLHINDLINYQSFKLINAMMLWEESLSFKIDVISNSLNR